MTSRIEIEAIAGVETTVRGGGGGAKPVTSYGAGGNRHSANVTCVGGPMPFMGTEPGVLNANGQKVTDTGDSFGSLKPTNPKDAIAGDKIPLWLLSPIAKAHWASAQFCGQVKYGAWNWREAGARASIYISAIDRHKDAYTSGELYDPVDGTHHLGNIMACCAILLEASAMGKLVDDRPPSFSIRQVYKEVQGQMSHMRVLYKNLNPRHYTINDTEAKNG